MRSLVLYYSLSGNTRGMAEEMASAINADIQPLVPVVDLPVSGFAKYWKAGQAVLCKSTPALMPHHRPPSAYDILLIGTPVWAGTFVPALRTFFCDTSFTPSQRIGLFCCHAGGQGSVFTRMREAVAPATVAGQIAFKDPLKHDLDASCAKAREWAKSLIDES